MSYVTKINQNIVVDPNNTTTGNLANGASFTGTGSLTAGFSTVILMFRADQNCTVQIQQSSDNTNWDITNSFTYYYSIDNFSREVQIVAQYVRVIVTNNGTLTTTFLRLQTSFVPISNPLPRATDAEDNLMTFVNGISDNYGFDVENTPMGEMRTVTPVRLVGAAFEGSTIDTQFWTVTTANAATITQLNTQVTLASGTNAAGSAQFNSVRRARYVSSVSNRFRSVMIMDAGIANNTRIWGVAFGASMPTITDGAYFKYTGTTFSVVTLKGGVETVINSGSFNGAMGAVFTPNTNAPQTFEIYWTTSRVMFVIGGNILHTITPVATPWANTVNHYIYMSNVNSGNTTNRNLITRTASIARLGLLTTAPKWFYQHGANAGVILKQSAGSLHDVIINANAGTSISLFDGTSAVNPIAVISPNQIGTLNYNLDFYNGLFVVSVGAACDFAIVYE